MTYALMTLRTARDLHHRCLRTLSSEALTPEVCQLLVSHDQLLGALRDALDVADGRELLIRAMVYQHGGRFRVTLGSLQAVSSTTPLRTLADLTFKHQVLELGASAVADGWIARLTRSLIVQAALGWVWRGFWAGRVAWEAWTLGRAVARARAAAAERERV